MKNRLQIFLLVFLSLPVLVWSCKTTPDNPKAVAQAFLDAIMQKQFDEAGKYATKESQPAMEMLKSAERAYKQFGRSDEFDIAKELRNKKVELTEPQMDGENRATVSVMADGQEKMPLILVKEQKQWKVAFDKATIMDTERKQ
jgi:hypothetical protein